MSDLVYRWYPTGSYSPGAIGPHPTRLCVHTTEGATTLASITGFIQGKNGVSYHAAVDNYSRGVCNEFVYESDGAWAQCNANGSTVCLVMCTPSGASASWSADYWWNQQAVMMDNAAKWLADQSAQYGIPLTELTSAQAQGSTRGVCQHKNLGSWGCSHSDCGNLPMGKLLDLARQYAAGGGVADKPETPAPASYMYEEETIMQLTAGEDGKAALPIPKYAGHLRLVCSQGGTVRVEWPGSSTATREYDLNDKKRVDVPTGAGSNGSCIVYLGDARGPVGAAWIQTN